MPFFFLLHPTLFYSLFHHIEPSSSWGGLVDCPLSRLGRICTSWGCCFNSRFLCSAAHWVTLALLLYITDTHCSLSVALSPLIPTGRACMQHVHVSGQSVYSLSLPLSPGHRKLPVFCLPVFIQPLQMQSNRIPFFATVYQPTAARLVPVRHKAHLPSLYQPESPCS